MTISAKLAKRVVQFVLAAAFLLLIVHFFDKYSADLSSITQLSVLDIVLLSVLLFGASASYAYCVFLILRELGLEQLRHLDWQRIYFASRFVNFFVLQGGNLFRLLVLKKRYAFSYANSVGVTVLVLWISAAIALALCSVSAMLVDGIGTSIRVQLWLAVAAILLLPLPGMLFSRSLDLLPDWTHRVREPLQSAAAVFSVIVKAPMQFAGMALLSLIHFLFFVAANYVAFVALDAGISVLESFIFSTAFVFTRYINIVPGNIGLAELLGGLISEIMGVGFGEGLLVVGLIRIVEIIMIVGVGFLDGNAQVWTFIRKKSLAG